MQKKVNFTVSGYFFFSVHSPATKNNMSILRLIHYLQL